MRVESFHPPCPRRAAQALIPVALLCAAAVAAETSTVRVTEIEGITEYRLANGLKVLLFPDPSVSTVTVNVTYLVGSRHEGRGEAGMAHLLEHMVFKGTNTYTNIWDALQDHGARFNGTTWVDRTNYFETLAATDENLDFALAMEADRMVGSLIKGEELAKEMTVVRNEFEMGENSPINVLRERMLSAAFLWHNYGKSTIGNRSDIERVPVESLRAFYERYYQPDNAMLVVAGRFDPETTLEKIERHFGSIPKPDRVLTETYTEEPVQDGPRSVVLQRVGSLASAGLLYHTPPGSHPDVAALDVLADVMTDRPSGRLYRGLVEADKAVGVSQFNASWHEPGVLMFQATVRTDQNVELAQQTMIDLVEGAAGDISEQEVTRSKAKILKEINLGMTDSRRIGIVLSEWEAMGDWRLMFLHRDRIKGVTRDDVNRVAANYLLESNRTSGLFIPTDEPVRAEIPTAPDVEQLLERYRGSESMATGAEFEATAANIERSTERLEVGPIDVALLPKQTRGNLVQARMQLRFGSPESLRGKLTASEVLPALMMRGTAERDYQGIEDELNRIESELNLSGGGNALAVSLKTTRSNLPAAIDLVAEILRQPSFPADELEVLRRQRLAQLERMTTDPQGLVFSAVTRALNPYPPESIYYTPTLEEQIERVAAVERQQIVDLHRQLLGADQLDVAMVGDIDPEEVAAMLERAFGDWRAESAFVHLERQALPIERLDQTIDTPDKKMAVVVRGATLPLGDSHPAYPSLQFANFILGQSPGSRLLTALRHEGGLSYGAGSVLQADDEDPFSVVMGYAICAPQNAVEAQQVMQQEFARIIAEPLQEQELTDFKVGYREAFRTRLADDDWVAAQLLADLRTGRPFTFHQELVDRSSELSPSDLQSTLQSTYGEAVFVDFKGGDTDEFGE